MSQLALPSRSPQLPKVGIALASSRAHSPRARAWCFCVGCSFTSHCCQAWTKPRFSLQPCFSSFDCCMLFGNHPLERVSDLCRNSFSLLGTKRIKGIYDLPSPEQSGFHQDSDQKLNNVTKNSSGNFFHVCMIRELILTILRA